jgi:hypothetical protein
MCYALTVLCGRLTREPPVPTALKEQLVLVIANALYYNPTIALSTLQQHGQLGWFFTLWFEVRSPLLSHHVFLWSDFVGLYSVLWV